MLDDTCFRSVAALRNAYSTGELCPVEVTETTLARIREVDPIVHAMSARLDDLARTQAAAAKESYRLGTAGRMAGIPVSIKDTFDIEGHVSTYGSLAFRTNLAVADSGSVRRLRAAG